MCDANRRAGKSEPLSCGTSLFTAVGAQPANKERARDQTIGNLLGTYGCGDKEFDWAIQSFVMGTHDPFIVVTVS